MTAKDLGLDVTWYARVNERLRKRGELVPGEPEAKAIIQNQLDRALHPFKTSEDFSAEELEAWESLPEQIHGKEFSPEGQQALQQLVETIGLRQIVALIESASFISRFKLEVVDIHPQLTVVWRAIPQE